MRTVAITGNMGCGKSTVAHIFLTLGVPIYNADREAKRIMAQDEVQNKLLAYFGHEICTHPKKIAQEIFNFPEKLAFINGLVHPLVKQDFETWGQAQNSPYILMESALIFESGWENLFDKLILVHTPEELQIQRIQERDHSSLSQIKDRLKNQIPSSQKIDQVDYLILNDEKHSLLKQVLHIHHNLLALS